MTESNINWNSDKTNGRERVTSLKFGTTGENKGANVHEYRDQEFHLVLTADFFSIQNDKYSSHT